jgi:hypothetical protein
LGWTLLASHNHIGEVLVGGGWRASLQQLAQNTGPGQLLSVRWGKSGLSIVVQYHRRWQTVEALVQLGADLTALKPV